MLTYKIAAVALAIAGLISALIAAWYWWKASRVTLPTPSDTFSFGEPTFPLMATLHALIESSRLNKTAALWTGGAAILSAIASILSVQ
jgi:hypothetical protein